MEVLEKNFERKPVFYPSNLLNASWHVHIFNEEGIVGSQKIGFKGNLNIGRDLIKNDNSIDKQYVSREQLKIEPLEKNGSVFVRITNTGKNTVLFKTGGKAKEISRYEWTEIPLEKLLKSHLVIGRKEEGRGYKVVFSNHSSEELSNYYNENFKKIKEQFTPALNKESIGGNAGEGAAAVNFSASKDGFIKNFTNNPKELNDPNNSRGAIIVKNVLKEPQVYKIYTNIDEAKKLLLIKAFNNHLKELGKHFSN